MRGPEWSVGDRVVVRGRTCEIHGVQAWPDCTVLRLSPPHVHEPARSLLTPFDRPRRIDRGVATRVVRNRRWLRELRRQGADLTPYGGALAAWRAPVRLLAYQVEPLLAVLRHGATRLLIADAVGLGKTIQAGLILAELAARDDGCRAIVIAPAGLRQQWGDELTTHLGLSPIQADAAWLRSVSSERPPEINPWSLPGIYLTSMDFAKRPEVLQALERVSWDLVVLDEAHLATSTSDRREAAHAVGSRSRRTILLTATPDAGDPIKFAALCRIGRVDDREPPLLLFRRTRAEVTTAAARRSVLLRIRPTTAERRMHALLERYADSVWREAALRHDPRAKLAAILLRKRALSSATSLAISVQRRLDLLAGAGPVLAAQLLLPLADEDAVDDEVDEGALAAPGLADAAHEQRWLESIAVAARDAARGESKAARLLRWLRLVTEPVIVFTEYRDTLMRLERMIRAAGRPLVVLHGGLDRHERVKVQRAFNAGRLSLLATDAAAEGLNLHHHCRIVLHYELPWRPARLEQRAGRVDRLGQTKRVHELALVAVDTAERLVLAPLVARAARARQAGDAASGLLDSLSEATVATLVMQPSSASGELPGADIEQTQDSLVRTMDLRIEAEQEVARLLARRASDDPPHRRTRRARPDATLISRMDRPSILPRGLIVVVDLWMADGTGRRVHGEAIALLLEGADRWANAESAAPMRALVEQLRSSLDRPDTRLGAQLAGAVAAMQDRIGQLHRAAWDRLRWRDDGMERAQPSAARHLVQAGLFDRRAVRARSQREALRDAQLFDAESRRHADGHAARLTSGHRLAAVLVVRRRAAGLR